MFSFIISNHIRIIFEHFLIDSLPAALQLFQIGCVPLRSLQGTKSIIRLAQQHFSESDRANMSDKHHKFQKKEDQNVTLPC